MTSKKDPHFFSNIQSDYAAWLSQILLSVYYDSAESRKEIVFPKSLTPSMEGGVEIPSRIIDSQALVHELANDMLCHVDKPEKEKMETFLMTYESFVGSLQQLENGLLLADYGIDSLTGLGTFEKMMAELAKELERRARRGQPFCFALSRIDGEENRKIGQNIILAARAIKKTIRSFDDAYVMGEGEFLSSLKHSDNSGGLKYVSRLNAIIREDPEINFTMSSIVAEPIPGDNLNSMIERVKQDLLSVADGKKGMAEQYTEISPLSQYLKSLRDSG
jgi:diguanylate cyclase